MLRNCADLQADRFSQAKVRYESIPDLVEHLRRHRVVAPVVHNHLVESPVVLTAPRTPVDLYVLVIWYLLSVRIATSSSDVGVLSHLRFESLLDLPGNRVMSLRLWWPPFSSGRLRLSDAPQVLATGIMHQHTPAANLVDVLALDFQVVDAVGFGTCGDGLDGYHAVGGRADFFAGLELGGLDEVAAGLTPEGVVRRAADRLRGAFDVDVDQVARRVVGERAGDHMARAGADRRTGAEREHLCRAVNPQLGHLQRDFPTRFGTRLLDPRQRTQQFHIQAMPVGLDHVQRQPPPTIESSSCSKLSSQVEWSVRAQARLADQGGVMSQELTLFPLFRRSLPESS